MKKHSALLICIIISVLASALAMPASAADPIGPDDFTWFLKDAPPINDPSFKARIKGYWYPLEDDWESWSTGARSSYESYCAIPSSKQGFYESVKCKGLGITKDKKVIGRDSILTTREASEQSFSEILDVLGKELDNPPARPRRTIAVNGKPGTRCYIPPWSRVYIKYKNPENPYNGWYIAEETSPALEGKCEIRIFLGLGKQDQLKTPSPDSPSNPSRWPEIWVFPAEKDQYLWDESLLYFIIGGPTSGMDPGEGGVPEDAYTESASAMRPLHPVFSADYSVNPSFSVSMPYDFQIYDTVPEALTGLSECKNDINCILSKVKEFEESTDSEWIVSQAGEIISKNEDDEPEIAEWQMYCETPEQHSVNSLAEALYSCSRSTESECICEYKIPRVKEDDWIAKTKEAVSKGLAETSDYLQLSFLINENTFLGDPERIFGLSLRGSDLRVFLTAEEAEDIPRADPQLVRGGYITYIHKDLTDQQVTIPEITIQYEGQAVMKFRYSPEISKWQYNSLTGWADVAEMGLTYGEDYKALAILLRTRDEEQGYSLFRTLQPVPKLKQGVPESSVRNFKLQYHENVEGLDIYRSPGMGIEIYPKGKSPTTSTCEVNTQTLKFCIVGKDTFFAYDHQKNSMGIQPQVLKFAYTITSGEVDMGDLEIKDATFATNTSIIIWDPTQGADVVSYNIYYGPDQALASTLRGKTPSQINMGNLGIKKVSLLKSSKTDVPVATDSLTSPTCVAEGFTCTLKYMKDARTSGDEGDVTLDTDKLYYSGPSEKFFYFMTALENAKTHLFAVTAVDKSNKETEFNLPKTNDAPNDDLPPGIAKINSIAASTDNIIFTIDPLTYAIDGSTIEPEDTTHYRVFCFEEGDTNLDTSAKSSEFAQSLSSIDGGKIQFSVPLAEMSAACGFTKTPHIARFAVAGMKKVGVNDVFHKGWISAESLSEKPIELP